MPLSALVVLLGWAEVPGSAGSRSHRKAGSSACSPCVGEGEERGPSTSGRRAHGHGVLALQRTRVLLGARRAGAPAGAGAAAGTPECSPCVVPAQGWQEPSCQGSEAPLAPLTLGPFAHTNALLVPWTRVPAKWGGGSLPGYSPWCSGNTVRRWSQLPKRVGLTRPLALTCLNSRANTEKSARSSNHPEICLQDSRTESGKISGGRQEQLLAAGKRDQPWWWICSSLTGKAQLWDLGVNCSFGCGGHKPVGFKVLKGRGGRRTVTNRSGI